MSGSKQMYALFLAAQSENTAVIWESKQFLPLAILKIRNLMLTGALLYVNDSN